MSDLQSTLVKRNVAMDARGTTVLLLASVLLSACQQEPVTESEPVEPTETQPAVVEEIVVPTNSILRADMDARSIDDPPMESINVTVPFSEGGTKLDEAANAIIAEIIESEQFRKGGSITLRGHTDSSGDDDANIRASRKRATSVATALKDAGATSEQITIIPMGEQNPIVPNGLPDGSPDAEGRAKNRRVEVIIAPPAEEIEVIEQSAQSSSENNETAPVEPDKSGVEP